MRQQQRRCRQVADPCSLDYAGITEPFGGRDLIYKKNGNGLVLYSIRPNLKDDQGQRDRNVRNGDLFFRPSEN